MQSIADLDPPDLPVETPEFAENPHRFFREARKKHPWLAKSSIGLLIHEYTAIRELLGQDEKFLPAYEGIVEVLGAHGTPWGRFTEEQLISLPTDQAPSASKYVCCQVHASVRQSAKADDARSHQPAAGRMGA